MVIDEPALWAGLHSASAERLRLIEAKEAAVIKALKILKAIHDKFRAASFEPIDMDLPAWRLRLCRTAPTPIHEPIADDTSSGS